MPYQYQLDPIAANEYEEAFDWYEQRSPAAADGFILAVQEAINAILANPERYRNTFKNLREITLKKYPFNIIYFIDEDKQLISIISIFHHKRNPKKKYKTKRSRKK